MTVIDTLPRSDSTRKRTNPLVADIDLNNLKREDIFSRAPSKTAWAEEMLTGASAQELDKTEPVNEKELQSIFPGASATVMKDPLTSVDKTRIHDNLRRDAYTQVAVFTYSYFMLGPDSTITLGLNRRYANEERKKEQMAVIMNDPQYLDMLETLMNRDDELEMQTRKLQLIFNGAAFGRSVMIKKYDKKDHLCDLIPLSSTRLGRVYVSREWKFLGVEYLDYTRDRRILLAKDIVHYENNDMMVTPRSRYYGMSMLEPLMAIGERNRVGNEISIPELFRKYWAPILLVKVNSGSQTKINQIRDIFSMPGKTQIYNDDIEVTQVALQHDLEKVIAAITEGAKDTFRGCTVPQGVGWSFDPNHATFEGSMLQWYNGTLAFKRSHLDSVLWLQLYKPQVEQMLEEQRIQKIPETNGLVDYLVENAARLQEGYEGEEPLPFRIMTEFKNIKTIGFLELSSALLGWKNANIINNEIALREGGLEQYIDDMAEIEQKKVQIGQDMLTQEQNMMMMQQQQPPPPPTTEGEGKGEGRGEGQPGAIKGVLDVTQRSLSRGL